ncbi:MAG: rhamnulokinase, partial [Acutalibacteraceae bacterium]|nr:rhamnulokinase [Acutalibacteraceae bacterium]
TSDACNVEVLAGPSEATVMGNIAVAYTALGDIKDLKDIRRVVSNSTELNQYLPENSEAWEEPYKEYLKILNR